MKFHQSLNSLMRQYLLIFGVFHLGILISLPVSASLSVKWTKATGETKILKDYNDEVMKALKQTTSSEKDPVDGKTVSWRGPKLSEIVNDALETVSPEVRSQIDLIVLKNLKGVRALLPRAFSVKYPLLVAIEKEGKPLGSRGPFQVVVPWTSKNKILEEDVPLESFFMEQLSEIEFTNYRSLFPNLYLSKRTDPAAVRGEKLFVQNCTSCHGVGQGPDIKELLKVQGDVEAVMGKAHKKNSISKEWKEREWRSVSSYLDAVRAQSSP